jgi:hypothetical protein
MAGYFIFRIFFMISAFFIIKFLFILFDVLIYSFKFVSWPLNLCEGLQQHQKLGRATEATPGLWAR